MFYFIANLQKNESPPFQTRSRSEVKKSVQYIPTSNEGAIIVCLQVLSAVYSLKVKANAINAVKRPCNGTHIFNQLLGTHSTQSIVPLPPFHLAELLFENSLR
jgi:hypothetical protein